MGSRPRNASAAKRLILLVDDDSQILALLGHSLLLAGYDVHTAQSGQSALELIAASERQPDLALLDICMPGLSGLELARRLRAETSIPVMFLSASEADDEVTQAGACGALGYLVKPINPAHIAPAIKMALARAEELRDLHDTKRRLTTALLSGRETGMAVGLLMERYKTGRDSAFHTLRDYARSHRRKLAEVATQILTAAEQLNSFAPSCPQVPGHGTANIPRENKSASI